MQFRIPLGDEELVVPDRPIDIPSGLIARWPLRLDLAGVRIEWATASVAGLVEVRLPTLVLRAHDGITARVRFAAGTGIRRGTAEDAAAMTRWRSTPGTSVVADGTLRILVVDERQAERLWYLGEELIDSVDALWQEPDGLVVRAAQQPSAARWTGTRFEPIALRTGVRARVRSP